MKAGHRVLEANDGEKALALLMEAGPAVIGLVVSDIAMPGMTGEDLAGSIAQRWPTIPVLLISGHTEPSSVYQGSFLGKPFRAESLQAVVSQLVAVRAIT
jgi:DNA-binding NtrC family response regulator